MNIEEAEKLGIEKATAEVLKIIKEKTDLNAILAINEKPAEVKLGN